MRAQPRTRLRSDARDNRERILAVARTAFAHDGIDVPVREIARRAQVGIATVYRHFPAKDVLLTAAFAGQMASCARIVEQGLAHEDPWCGFCQVINQLIEVHARDRGLARAFTSGESGAASLAAERNRTLSLLLRLVRRAKDSGALRADLVPEDIILMLMANEGIRAETPELRAAASRRFAAFVIQSFRAGPEPAEMPHPVRLPLLPT